MADVELSTLGSVIKTAYEAEANTNAYTDAEKSKLAGVEASADVTDTANVTAAGALMDSEVTNLAQVKAFDSSDYATAAQGATADAALPADGSGEMTGDLVFAEAADHSSTPGAGKGYVWVKNTAPSTLIFTNDAGTDTTLGSGGGASQLSDLSDVNTSTATNRNVLVADGVDWESRALTEADISDLGSYLPLSGGTLSGNIAFSGAQTVDGRDVSADGSKLDGIESSADVTDAANVASAGAVMADGTGNDITGDLVFTEKADHSSTPGAGKGYLWVKSDTPSSLIYTDDAGTDYDLTAAGGGDLWSDAVDSDIVPTGADSTYDLGTTTDRFAQTYTDTIWITDGDITASVADGASAVAFDFNNTAALSTSGAKLASFKNNGTEKAYIDKDGDALFVDVNASNLTIASGGWVQLPAARGIQNSESQLSYLRITGGGTTSNGAELRLSGRRDNNYGHGAVSLSGATLNTDTAAAADLSITATSAYASASTYLDGGNVTIAGGAGASGSAGDADGGHIYLDGGQGYGTGAHGSIIIGNTRGDLVFANDYTVSALPSGAAVGTVARVTDANAPAVGSTVSGGGAAAALVWYNGSNWTVIGV